MRARWFLACALAASGCGSSAPTAIEIDVGFDPTAVDHVVVFLAGASPVTDAIATSATAPQLATQIFGRLDGPAESLPATSTRTPGEAVFVYERGADAAIADIPYAIVLGMSADPKPTVVAVGSLANMTMVSGEVRAYTVTLGPAGPLASKTTAGVRGVELWGGSDAPDSCVRVQADPSDESQALQAIVISTDDPDCDGAKPECEPLVANGETVGSALACAGTFPVTNLAGALTACELGAPACEDGKPRACVAAPEIATICAPPSLCTVCHQPDVEIATCVAQASDNDFAAMTHVDCTFYASSTTTGTGGGSGSGSDGSGSGSGSGSGQLVLCEDSEALPPPEFDVAPMFLLADHTRASSIQLFTGAIASINGTEVQVQITRDVAPVVGTTRALVIAGPGGTAGGIGFARAIVAPIAISIMPVANCKNLPTHACMPVDPQMQVDDPGTKACLGVGSGP